MFQLHPVSLIRKNGTDAVGDSPGCKGGSMEGRNRLILSAVVIVLLAAAGTHAADDRLSLCEELRLYPAPKQYDSYSLYYDITLETPGLICVGLEIDGVFPEIQGKGNLLSVSLRSRDEEVEMRFAQFGRDGGTFSYGVDAYEFDRMKGEYRIVVSNWSLERTVAAKLIAVYPGSKETGNEGKVIMIPGSTI